MHWKRLVHAFLLGTGMSVVGVGCAAVDALVSSPAGRGASSSSPERLIAVGRVFENMNISLIGRNLLSFDDYQGYDPETNSAGQTDRVRGDDFGNVPIPRMIQVRLGARF